MAKNPYRAQSHMNTEDFISNSFLNRNAGLLRKNRFIITTSLNDDRLQWNAVQVNCPGVEIGMQDGEFNGVPRWAPRTRQDNEMSITFLETPMLEIRRLFSNLISGGVQVHNEWAVTRNYLKNLYMTIKVMPLTPKGNAYNGDIFEHCFPYSVGAMDYNTAEENSIGLTEVKFKYVLHRVF